MSSSDPQDPRSRPLADDPGFMASLSDLDAGLGGPGGSHDSRDSTGSESEFPVTAPAPLRPAAPRQARPPLPPLPPLIRAPGKRPLLDLFPSLTDAPPSTPTSTPRARPLDPPGGFFGVPPRRDAVPAAAAPAASAPADYETFYGLRERPFSLSSDLKFLYQSSEYDRVTQQMLGAIGRREPLVLLTGQLGVGKTTLCRALVEQLDRRTLTSVVTEPFASVEDLLKTLLIDFGVVNREDVARGQMASATPGELVVALREFLGSLALLQAFAVVIIDEAQMLAPALLNALTPLVGSGEERLLQIVLVGQPVLADALDKGPAKTLGSAVTLRCVLGPLSDDEVGGYVMHRLRVAGSSPRVEFDDAAFAKLYAVSGGLPRLVNLLCDRALATAVTTAASTVPEGIIDRAAEDLDMAPPPSRRGVFGSPATLRTLVLLMLAGAAAGALTFHADLAALISALGR